MGGGHHVHVVRNENNMQESDAEMQHKIQRVELVKFNPNHFHLDMLSPQNWYEIAGGMPTMVFSGVGACFAYAYYAGQAAHLPYNFYAHNMRVFGRLAFGAALGFAFGYSRFGDRQRLHNAWVAERLRRRYPESMNLHEHDLWSLKGVQAPHEFYRWV